MKLIPDAREYAKAAPHATPAEAFHAGVMHERARQRSSQKAALRKRDDAMLATVAKALVKNGVT